jgi:hypothetical protein
VAGVESAQVHERSELASVDYSLEVVDGCKGTPRAWGFASQYSGELTLRSNDGRIDGAFPVELYNVFAPSPSSGGNHAVFAFGSYDGTTDPESFAPLLQSFGIRDAIDTAAFDALAVEISGHIDLNSARRTLRVDGLRGGRCAVEPSSGRSLCAGSEATTLWRVVF